MRASDTSSLVLEDCRIPEGHLLGSEGDGFVQAMKVLDGGRISIAALGLGTAIGAYETALAYAKERDAFGCGLGLTYLVTVQYQAQRITAAARGAVAP